MAAGRPANKRHAVGVPARVCVGYARPSFSTTHSTAHLAIEDAYIHACATLIPPLPAAAAE